MTMQRSNFHDVVYLFLLIVNIDVLESAVLTNLCPATSSCNCTLTDAIELTIICDSTPTLFQLPSLSPTTLQTGVTQLSLSSSVSLTKGPLVSLPTNICDYPNLNNIDLSWNNISGFLNTSVLACLGSNLLTVDLSYNNIDAIDTNFFQSNPSLQSLNLAENNLTTMPTIDSNRFVNFPSTFQSMNFSYNQITSVDLWPLFVRTGNLMTIDMSYNLIVNYTNTIPISLAQFTNTPDLRYFYLNNNRLNYLSDLLLEQYGACATTSPLSTAVFVVGISNVLLTNNPLVCDCQSFNLIDYINDNIIGFPDIFNGTALITQATCSSPSVTAGQEYLLTDFSLFNDCTSYTLPSITGVFCSYNANDTTVTLAPPTYWPTTTVTIPTNTSTTNGVLQQSSSVSSSRMSPSIAWYIILGVILGIAVLLAVIVILCYLCRDRICSKFLNDIRTKQSNPNDSYDHIIRKSETLSQRNSKLNGTKDGDHGSHSIGIQPEQETQTYFPPERPKRSNDPLPPARRLRPLPASVQTQSSSYREQKSSHSIATDAATSTGNVVKGIPISAAKITSLSPNVTVDTSISELSVTSIPLTASKRAKLLPPVKGGVYADSGNANLLNTSAGALLASERRRRRSSMWFRKQNQNMISPLPPRPQSMVAQKTVFDYEGSFDEDIPSMPTIESLTEKPAKPLRTVPLLNITVVPAWIDDPT